MRWIVGIDLGERCSGTVHMAAWLRAHARGRHEFVGIHVVDERLRNSAKVMSEVIAAGEKALQRVAEHSGVENPFSDLRVILAPSVEDGLSEAATTAGIDGALIGRAAPPRTRKLVRLGSVARRMLRRLPAPLLVVPPYITGEEMGRGGVLLATDLSNTSISAGRIAARLAGDLGRELVVTHVDPGNDFGRDLLGETTLAAWMPRRTIADVEHWIRSHDLGDARARLCDDSVPEGVLAEAQHLDSALIACGSRRLNTVDRIFTSSIGSDLARLADRPVLVVPAP